MGTAGAAGTTIEDVVLSRDRRGISELRRFVAGDFCDRAARLIYGKGGTAIVATGFYILDAGDVETDGPPGAVAIGNALERLGFAVVYATDAHGAAAMDAVRSAGSSVVEFPIAGDDESERFARGFLAEHDPSVVVAIERCGMTAEGKYRNMRGRDITAHTARLDYLFSLHGNTVGIGDGGNEIGMGNVAAEVTGVESLVREPCVTGVSELVLASVSNWGGYGLVAALSRLAGVNLLPTVAEDAAALRACVDAGAVDGMSGLREYKADGFTLEENGEVLGELHALLAGEGVV